VPTAGKKSKIVNSTKDEEEEEEKIPSTADGADELQISSKKWGKRKLK